MKPAGLVFSIALSIAYLMTILEVTTTNAAKNENELVDQHDCECKNDVGGLYCGNSEQLKALQGEGCRPHFLYNCTRQHKYPQEIFRCADGYDCKINGGGKDECVEGPPGPEDCKCKNNKAATYCGVEKGTNIESNKGSGCRRDHIYQCKNGNFAKLIRKCKENYVCVFSASVKPKCVARKPDVDECACNNDIGGNYCGGSKYLKSKKGLGCQRNYIFNCIDYGKDNGFYPDSDKTKKCKTGTKCVSSKPGKASCQKSKK